METPEQEQADFTVVLSSDLISQVMEQYFNTDMFKMAVRVVDLQAKGDAYAFNLAFVTPHNSEKVKVAEWGIAIPDIPSYSTASLYKSDVKRGKNGKFVKVERCQHDIPIGQQCTGCQGFATQLVSE